MSQIYHIYCDESCHLEKDNHGVMILGAVWCPKEKVREITTRLKEIKARHNLKPDFEIKWTKVSPAKQQFYLDILDYFFDDDDLHLRAVVVPDKSKLKHDRFQQTHDEWYYKMYFTMLKAVLNPEAAYYVYLDIKDTRSADKLRNLQDVLCGHMQDQDRKIIKWLQTVRSHEVGVMQLTDLLIGALGYANRGLQSSTAKSAFVTRFRNRSYHDLTRSTLPLEHKTNLLIWQAKEAE